MEETPTLETTVGIRMTEELRAKIEKLATEDQRTFSQMARILLEKGYTQHTRFVVEPKNGKKQ